MDQCVDHSRGLDTAPSANLLPNFAFRKFRLGVQVPQPSQLAAENRSVINDLLARLRGLVAQAGIPALAKLGGSKTSTVAHLSVRFGRLAKTVRLPDGSPLPEGKTFHSLRKCFSMALERAGCPEAVAVRLLGHAAISISYRVYSAGRDVAQLKPWVGRIAFTLD